MLELLFWAFVVAFIIAAVIAVATENSGRRANRLKYATIVASCIFAILVLQAVSQQARSGAIFVLVLACAVVLEIWLVRTSVQRLRDAGLPKGLAYLAIVPVANWLLNLYLFFPASRPPREEVGADDKHYLDFAARSPGGRRLGSAPARFAPTRLTLASARSRPR